MRGMKRLGRRASMLAAAWAVSAGVLFGEPRCVIFFIGDGMGPEQVKAGSFYAFGSAGQLIFESFPYQGQLTTYSADNAVTDSAAAGTALATGTKVNNYVVSMAYPGDGHELETLLERLKSHGKRTGLVTTTYITHATPATFGAHEPTRDNYAQIAGDMLNQTRPNVLLGGGANGMSADSAQAAGYTVVTDAAGMLALDDTAVSMVSGQFGSTYLPYEYDGLGSYPHLSQMTATALDILEEDPDGFFLMVEGGLIDQACHSNDIARSTLEAVELHNAVNTALTWAQGRTDTLILVAADHETGGLTAYNNGVNQIPGATWTTTGHTATNVPVYAWGQNADLIGGVMDNTDMVEVVTYTREASNPAPADGATGVSIALALTWRAGDGSVSHDVYFGTDADPLFAGTVTSASFNPGVLSPSTEYHWAVDERDSEGVLTPHVTVWSFTTAAPPGPAGTPAPADETTDVVINVNPTWSAAANATSYNVYFGTDPGAPALVSAGQTGTAYDAGILAANTTYYWRIDSLGAGGTCTGAAWSFTTGTSVAPIDAFANGETTTLGTRTGDYTLTAAGDGVYEALHEVLTGGNKRSALTHTWTLSVTPGASVTFYVQAYHSANTENDHFLFAYSTDNSTFTSMLTVTNTAADGYQTFSLPPASVGTLYIRATDTDATRGNTALDTLYVDHLFVRTMEVSAPPGAATNPSPADDATGVAVDVTLSWTAGTGATSHDVYFGASPILGAESFVGNQDENTFTPPALVPSATYYWRIDEVNAVGATTGAVWSFTTGATCTPATMHVAAIVCGVKKSGSNYKGQVQVTIVDNCGNPVANATVTGAFTGTYNETRSAVTGSNGTATLTTAGTSKTPAYTFTVQTVTHATLTYAPEDNVETSDSY